MILTEVHLKIAGLLLSVIVVIIGIVKTYQANARKIAVNESNIDSLNQSFNEMKTEQKERWEKFESHLIRTEQKDSLEHAELTRAISSLSVGIAKIDGYISAKKEIKKND